MNLKKVLVGIEVLKKYYKTDEEYNIGAEHDIIYMFPTDEPMLKEDILTMIELGWIQDKIEFNGVDDYDHQESWAAYV